MGRRIGAYLIDALLTALIVIPIAFSMFNSKATVDTSGRVTCGAESSSGFETGTSSQFCWTSDGETHYIPEDEASSFTASIYGIAGAVQIANVVILQGLTGASIGKLLTGLRVIRSSTGKRVGIGWAALRWVVGIVDSFCCGIIGLVLANTTKGHRRLGDMAAGTVVVGKNAMGSPPAIPGLTAPIAAPYTYQPGATTAQPGWGTQMPTTPAAPAEAPSAEKPTWDPARNAYIQYDRALSAWMQWDDAAKAWKPISQ
jgi:uncharacterized RDD family membrane protein YckC